MAARETLFDVQPIWKKHGTKRLVSLIGKTFGMRIPNKGTRVCVKWLDIKKFALHTDEAIEPAHAETCGWVELLVRHGFVYLLPNILVS